MKLDIFLQAANHCGRKEKRQSRFQILVFWKKLWMRWKLYFFTALSSFHSTTNVTKIADLKYFRTLWLMLTSIFLLNKLLTNIYQGIIQKKSTSGSRTSHLAKFDGKVPFFQKVVLFYGISGKKYTKSALFSRFQTLP